MSTSEISALLERQLLLHWATGLRACGKHWELARSKWQRAGITRNTLRAVEAGDPAPSIGTYLRVTSALGLSGELALLAGDTLQPPPAGSAAARSRRAAPVVQVCVSTDNKKHQLQDLQSLALHEEAVRLAKANPALVQLALDTAKRWLSTGDSRSTSLWREWQASLEAGSWRKALGRTRHAQQLRQASPLVTVLPEEVRQRILKDVRDLNKGVVIDGMDIYPLQAPEVEDPAVDIQVISARPLKKIGG